MKEATKILALEAVKYVKEWEKSQQEYGFQPTKKELLGVARNYVRWQEEQIGEEVRKLMTDCGLV